MTANAVLRLWAEPRAAHPPPRVWRDWALVTLLAGAAVLENLLRDDVRWRPATVLPVVVLAFALLWRRTHPLAAVVISFGSVVLLDLASTLAGVDGSVGLGAVGFILVLVYALFRWASGRDAAIGSGIVLVTYVVGTMRDYTGLPDAMIAFGILAFPAVLGVSLRILSTSRLQELDQVRLREREQLARELHDTVAHHVSAMVIRAQAGRVVASTNPAAAGDALEVIEAEGSRTLAEMRLMVGALRERQDAELAPQGGVSDIERLARTLGDQPLVEVQLTGDLDAVGPSVDAAVFRIAQESITNAMRHARHATRVVVRVEGDQRCVRVTVSDDGDAVSGVRGRAGYGLVGMTERVTLLGGSIEVGPDPDRGWVVDAVIPRSGRRQ